MVLNNNDLPGIWQNYKAVNFYWPLLAHPRHLATTTLEDSNGSAKLDYIRSYEPKSHCKKIRKKQLRNAAWHTLKMGLIQLVILFLSLVQKIIRVNFCPDVSTCG